MGCIIWHIATRTKMEECRAHANKSSPGTPPTCSTFLYLPCEVPVGKEVQVSEEGRSRKRQRNPENWKKHFKRSGVRKNAPTVAITNQMECCKKKCLQKFSPARLMQVRSNFQSLTYDQQNISLDGLLHCRQTKKTSGHQRKTESTVSSSGKRIGRPPAEDGPFSFEYTL